MFIITTAVGGLLRQVYAVLVCIALWLQEPASPPLLSKYPLQMSIFRIYLDMARVMPPRNAMVLQNSTSSLVRFDFAAQLQHTCFLKKETWQT
jgi:hypothetical protein